MNTAVALKKNLISNVVLFVLNGIISFWLPPFLVKSLGIGAYGLIPLSTSMVGYAAIVTVAINSSLSRFLALDINNQNFEAANKTWNTAFTSLAVLLSLLAPFLFIFAWNVSSFISVPAGLEHDVSILFTCVSVGFIMSAFTSVFNSSAYVANRLDLVNRVSVINTYMRVILIFVIFLLIRVSLGGYGTSILIASVISSSYSFYLFRKFTPDIKINFKLFDRSVLSEMLSMGWWLIVIQLGSILFLQIDLLVINKTLGNVAAGQYGLILQWSHIIRTLAIALSGALGPLILNLYAKKEFDQMIRLTKLSNKALSLFIGCIVGVLCIISPALFSIWMGKDFSNLKWLFMIALLPLPINLGVLPLFSLNRAYNKLRTPGIYTLFMGACNLGLAIFLVKETDLKLYGVAVASGIVLTFKNFIFMPIYVAGNMGIKRTTFFRASLSTLVLLAMSVFGAFYYFDYFTISNWPQLIIHSGILFCIFAGVSFLLLTQSERKMILSTILKKTKKK
ncbi:lipopolysaccharide biosynthesis protein [Dyadobacter sandarakinus]|uniref:Oligosaccharide flippase family protein n=1 Tax=Dyadobacter sandarakinus TaxID=2747268 RepID=A0ABX7I0D8_9BACT|nr:oligosaccharide flippase family protein [Dyadobacter sandarakinus]QRQ99470.1 oligosaccharide flippase family protein [Dyadobacter sandarakinus]